MAVDSASRPTFACGHYAWDLGDYFVDELKNCEYPAEAIGKTQHDRSKIG